MKRFKFRLQTLLDQRQAREEELLRELSAIRSEQQRELTKLQRLQEISDSAYNKLDAMLGESQIDPVYVRQLEEFARACLDDIDSQNYVLEEISERVRMKMAEVVEAMKQRKVLESLKEKQETEHKLSELQAEQRQLDEISSLRYARGI